MLVDTCIKAGRGVKTSEASKLSMSVVDIQSPGDLHGDGALQPMRAKIVAPCEGGALG